MRDLRGRIVTMELPDRRQLTEEPFDPPPPAKVSDVELEGTWVVVCVHNRPDVSIPCLRAFHQRTPIQVGLAIVDDASDPHTQKLLEAEAASMRADGRRCGGIRHDENVRYTRAINSGFEIVFEDMGAEWAVSLNSDTLVTEGWIEEMIAVGRPDDVGMVCPYMTNAALLTFDLLPGVSYIEQAARLAHYARGRSVDAVTPVGACMAVRRGLWAEIGPFDVERCPQGYGEECHFWALAVDPKKRHKAFPDRKLRAESWQALLACGALVLHLSHASYGTDADELERAAVETFKREHGDLLEARRRRAVAQDPKKELEQKIRQIKSRSERPRLYFYLPHVQLCGGMLALANIINGLTERGIDAALAYTFDRGLREIPMTVGSLNVGADPSSWVRSGGPKDAIVMATAWFTGDWVSQLANRNAGIQAGCFVQDYEAHFIKADGRPEYVNGAPPAYVALARSPFSVVNSNWVREAMRQDLDAAAAEYIPIGVDPNLFYDRGIRGRGERRVQILAMYRPETPRRGDQLLREVYRKLHDKYGDRVDLATYGSNVVPTEIPVTQLGILPQSELAKIMATTHILIEPSSVQGWGMPGQEAMASGACLVSTKNGGIANYGRDGHNCIIADSGSLFDAACKAVEERDLREYFGKNAREDMLAFSWDNICDEWARVVRGWWATLAG